MLSQAVRELAKFGPMKPQDEHGMDGIKEQYEGAAIEKSATYAADPSGMRTGNGPGPQLAETLERVCQDAQDVLSPDLVKRRVAVSMEMLEDKHEMTRLGAIANGRLAVHRLARVCEQPRNRACAVLHVAYRMPMHPRDIHHLLGLKSIPKNMFYALKTFLNKKGIFLYKTIVD